MVRAGCVFVASIHPSRTWTSGSFELVRWNACVHRLDLSLYCHPKKFLGEWSFNPCLLQGKNPLYRKMSPEEDRTHDAVDSEPKHYQRAIPAPIFFFWDCSILFRGKTMWFILTCNWCLFVWMVAAKHMFLFSTRYSVHSCLARMFLCITVKLKVEFILVERVFQSSFDILLNLTYPPSDKECNFLWVSVVLVVYLLLTHV